MSVLTTGYPSLDHIARVSHSPAVGETARLLAVPDSYTFGGCGANIAVALARLGCAAGVAMVLGDDAYARDYLAYLQRCGVDTAHCEHLRGERTSHSFLYLNAGNEYQNFFFPGAADAWRGQLQWANADSYRLAVVTVGQLAYNIQFMQQAAAHGIPLVWVTKADVFAYPAEQIGAFLAHSRVVIMNHIEAAYVLESLGHRAIADLLSATTQTIVVTRGAEDVLVHTAAGSCTVKTVAPHVVVDPTGAGDAFAAGFVAGMLRNAPADVCAQLGSVVASFVLEAVGCQTNLPTWQQATARYTAHFGQLGMGL